MGFSEDDRIRNKNLQFNLAEVLVKNLSCAGLNRKQKLTHIYQLIKNSAIRNDYLEIARSIIERSLDEEEK